jgi:hypothetical protein
VSAPPNLGCRRPPEGWYCSRERGHDGPCAARPQDDVRAAVVTITRPGDLVEVEWIDSGGQSGWHDPEISLRGFDQQGCITVGYLLEDSERGVGLVMGAGASGMHMDSVTIPRVNVVRVTRLGPEAG